MTNSISNRSLRLVMDMMELNKLNLKSEIWCYIILGIIYFTDFVHHCALEYNKIYLKKPNKTPCAGTNLGLGRLGSCLGR